MKFKWHLIMAGITLSATSCSTLRQSENKNSAKAITIELKIKPGSYFDTGYHSHAYIRNYSDKQLTREKHESVDFVTRTTAIDYNEKLGLLRYKVRTISKDGTVNLHELAFPEKNEDIDFIVKSDARVMKAGPYPSDSLFFVPSLPVPKGPVEVGDTWTMTHNWNSAAEKIPLRLEIIGILKNIMSCEGGKTCAEIEISGGVKLAVPPTAEGALFTSRIWGRMVFGVERGDILWSEVRSEEEMGSKGDRVVIQSCMASETKTAANFKTNLNCEPGEKPASPAPKL